MRRFVPILLCLIYLSEGAQAACKKTICSRMRSCEEAMTALNRCGFRSLDADHDGRPCEALCGDFSPEIIPLLSPASEEEFSCNRKTCKSMTSCDEAMYQLHQCGNGRLDRDGDGIPCEALCGG
jgi:Excalibur calcium-binding domain